jgi:hypothetical protein
MDFLRLVGIVSRPWSVGTKADETIPVVNASKTSIMTPRMAALAGSIL